MLDGCVLEVHLGGGVKVGLGVCTRNLKHLRDVRHDQAYGIAQLRVLLNLLRQHLLHVLARGLIGLITDFDGLHTLLSARMASKKCAQRTPSGRPRISAASRRRR